MKYTMFEQLETQNLILRRFRREDAECFFARVGGNEKVSRYMLWQPHKSLQESKESIEKILSRYEGDNAYTWGIALRSDDSIIGRIDLLRFDEKESSCSFAYMIGDEFWGQGFGTEALKAVLQFAFEKMEMQTVIADHMSENVASGIVMKKAGMHYVQNHVSKYEKDGKCYDADEYMITYKDWKASC